MYMTFATHVFNSMLPADDYTTPVGFSGQPQTSTLNHHPSHQHTFQFLGLLQSSSTASQQYTLPVVSMPPCESKQCCGWWVTRTTTPKPKTQTEHYMVPYLPVFGLDTELVNGIVAVHVAGGLDGHNVGVGCEHLACHGASILALCSSNSSGAGRGGGGKKHPVATEERFGTQAAHSGSSCLARVCGASGR
jgi:hypothetical protein